MLPAPRHHHGARSPAQSSTWRTGGSSLYYRGAPPVARLAGPPPSGCPAPAPSLNEAAGVDGEEGDRGSPGGRGKTPRARLPQRQSRACPYHGQGSPSAPRRRSRSGSAKVGAVGAGVRLSWAPSAVFLLSAAGPPQAGEREAPDCPRRAAGGPGVCASTTCFFRRGQRCCCCCCSWANFRFPRPACFPRRKLRWSLAALAPRALGRDRARSVPTEGPQEGGGGRRSCGGGEWAVRDAGALLGSDSSSKVTGSAVVCGFTPN